MRKNIILFVFSSFCVFADEPKIPDKQVRFITDYYRGILAYSGAEREKFVLKTPFFSKSLLGLMAKNKSICEEKSRGDDICGFDADGDIFLDTQESGPGFNFKNSDFKASLIAPDLVEASFTVWPKEHDYYQRKIRFKMVKDKFSWLVDDVIYINNSKSGATSDSERSLRKQIETENEALKIADRTLDEAWSWITIYIQNKEMLSRVSKLTSFPVEICNQQNKCKKIFKSESESFKKALLQLNYFYGEEGKPTSKAKHEWPTIYSSLKAKLSQPIRNQTVRIGPLTLIFKKEAWWLSKIEFERIGK
jgi:hypothetical protein